MEALPPRAGLVDRVVDRAKVPAAIGLLAIMVVPDFLAFRLMSAAWDLITTGLIVLLAVRGLRK